ncbi:MAG: hypothetical protein ABIZ30_10790 [Candidatus Limnocylindrales bacterium]
MTVTPYRSVRDRLIRPTLGELWTFLAVALPVLAALIATLPTVDLAYQLRAGAEILDGQGIPTSDTWTFTAAGLPWLDQQWGAQVVLAATYQVAGWTGLAIFRAALVGLVAGLILLAVRLRAPEMRSRTAALLGLAAFVVMAPALALRPQLLGMVLFAATLAILAGRRARPRAVWLVPVLAVLWANVHGSFILAPVLVGLAWLEDTTERSTRGRATFLAALATGAATLVTPFGFGAWGYAVGITANRQVTAQVSEWQPPTITDVPGMIFWGSVVLVGGAALLLIRRGRGAPDPWAAVLALIAFGTLGAMTGRGLAWWPGVAVVTLAGLVAQTGPIGIPAPRTTRGSKLNALVAGVLVVAGIALLPAWRPVDPDLGVPRGLLGQAPPGITAALRELATSADRVWNPQVWGSWLEFAVPKPMYAFDSRIEVIPAEVWSDASVVAAAGSGWDQILERGGATIVITDDPETSPLAAALATVPLGPAASAWHRVYADSEGSIWVRSDRR